MISRLNFLSLYFLNWRRNITITITITIQPLGTAIIMSHIRPGWALVQSLIAGVCVCVSVCLCVYDTPPWRGIAVDVGCLGPGHSGAICSQTLLEEVSPPGSFPSASYFPGAALITDGDYSEQNSPVAVLQWLPAIEIGLLSPAGRSKCSGWFFVSKARWPSNCASESAPTPIKILAPNWHSITIFGMDE